MYHTLCLPACKHISIIYLFISLSIYLSTLPRRCPCSCATCWPSPAWRTGTCRTCSPRSLQRAWIHEWGNKPRKEWLTSGVNLKKKSTKTAMFRWIHIILVIESRLVNHLRILRIGFWKTELNQDNNHILIIKNHLYLAWQKTVLIGIMHVFQYHHM